MTTQININTKSQLAKLIATENLTVQHNNVKTASFDTLNRILTLPIFKVQTGDIYDMLIAHECSHALYTPTKAWQSICHDDELRAYVNVIEDCRIDKKIQKKYPGVVKNYLQGFDDMMSKNFFGLEGKDYNKDLMLIDKINMYYKSSKRLDINFSDLDKVWVKKVDNVKSFKDVVELAKKMLDWQKKQLEKMKKLPDFDSHPLVENYQHDSKEDSDNNVNTKDSDSSDNNSDKSNETNSDDEDSNKDGNSKSASDDAKDGDNKSDEKPTESIANDLGAGSGASGNLKLTAVTNVSLDSNKERLYDDSKSYNYTSIPDVKLNNTIHTYKKFISNMRQHIASKLKESSYADDTRRYIPFLKSEFTKFKKDNKKTVMYLVKEFEMKKAATAYKKATTDKTGVIDPLKLKNYKFSDDIFKRLTILPDSKNHGMMMLLDWSGSMSDILSKTVDQLINLVYFCQKINIPYEVYFFNSLREQDNYEFNTTCFNYKHGDMFFDPFMLVNVASHRMKKTELDESLMYLYSMSQYWASRYSYRFDRRDEEGYNYGMPDDYWLGNTPLNEGLVACDKLIKIFKQKYNVEKMSFITLTDGASNYTRGKVENTTEGLKRGDMPYDGKLIIKDGKKSYNLADNEDHYYSGEKLTASILNVIKKKHNIKTIGFYLIKRSRGYENDRFFRAWGSDRDAALKRKKEFSKDKVCTYNKPGYDEYFLVNVKNMAVQNTDLSTLKDDMKAGKIKQIFSKSMKGRITSRVLLNKFIQNVA